MVVEQNARSYAEGTLDDPRLADDAALEGESPSLTLAQRPHDLEEPDLELYDRDRIPAHD